MRQSLAVESRVFGLSYLALINLASTRWIICLQIYAEEMLGSPHLSETSFYYAQKFFDSKFNWITY